jgi:CxxC motif-containing protein
VALGDVIVADILGTGAAVIATRPLDAVADAPAA